MVFDLWKPAVYHGNRIDRQFFEGWYFKLISADQNQRFAVIPGVFTHPDPALRHAFIQVLNGVTNQVIYHRYPNQAFYGSKKDFEVRIEDNIFSPEGIYLNIDNEKQSIRGKVEFEQFTPWPVKPFSPGVMGPYRFAPFMQTYHGILSLDHGLDGKLEVDGKKLEFSGGRGYIEKDWGRTFPRAYIWMQSNHFAENGTSITASVATIPWLGSWFRGFLVGFYHHGTLYRFTTYLGSEISRLVVDDHQVTWDLTGLGRTGPNAEHPGYSLKITAARAVGGLLSSPELDGMTPRILESLTAEIEVTLRSHDRSGKTQQTIFQGRGQSGGLEVAGSIQEIADQIEGKDS